MKKAAPPLAGGAAAAQKQNGTDEPSRSPPHVPAAAVARRIGLWRRSLRAALLGGWTGGFGGR
jgi:hypothetical protein